MPKSFYTFSNTKSQESVTGDMGHIKVDFTDPPTAILMFAAEIMSHLYAVGMATVVLQCKGLKF